MRLLLVTAVEKEAAGIRGLADTAVVVAGIGRTNAAAATTEAILRDGPFDAVMSVGIAGALPGGGLALGAFVVASSCVYAEEGILTPEGFDDIGALGFPLGDFSGNAVPVHADLLDALTGEFPTGAIATVATCSGTDAAAEMIARRTGALAEAMEGAAVVHAARRLRVPGIEARTISNTTGDRSRQQWDLDRALATLHRDVPRAVESIRSSGFGDG